MSDKLIISAAVCGSSPTKEQNPNVPYTPEEIANQALDAWRAGAAIAHIHVRDPQTGAPDSRVELFAEVVERIRAESNLLINLTTSGFNITGPDADERRLDPLSLEPDLCSLTSVRSTFAIESLLIQSSGSTAPPNACATPALSLK